MRTNADRALNGRDLAEPALGATMGPDDYDSGLVDALTNLLHFARRYGIDFAAQLATATGHHEVEATYDWDEQPGMDPKAPPAAEPGA